MSTSGYGLQDMTTDPLPDTTGMKVGIVVSEWNSNITDDLLEGCVTTLNECGVDNDRIHIERVPGSFELVFGCSQMIKEGQVDGVVAIGCVIRGDTPHFEYISQGVTQGLSELNVRGECPVIFGLLTTNNVEQAEERSGGMLGNKGCEYAVTVIKMIDFVRRMKHGS